MVRERVGDWILATPHLASPERDSQMVAYQHEEMPIRGVAESGGSLGWSVAYVVRGDARTDIAGRWAGTDVGGREGALRALYDWMGENPRPADIVNEDLRSRRDPDARWHRDLSDTEFVF